MEWLDYAAKNYSLIIVGGDVGDIGAMDRILAFAAASPRPMMVVPGNHDLPMTELWSGSSILHIASRKVGRYLVGGIGGSLPVQGSPLEFDETEFLTMTRNLGPVDIFVAHQPPIDTKCDVAFDNLSPTGMAHIGSVAIRKYVEEIQPRLGLFGHVHESPAVDLLGKTVIVNPGTFQSGNFAEIDITPSYVRAKILNMTGRPPLTAAPKLTMKAR